MGEKRADQGKHIRSARTDRRRSPADRDRPSSPSATRSCPAAGRRSAATGSSLRRKLLRSWSPTARAARQVANSPSGRSSVTRAAMRRPSSVVSVTSLPTVNLLQVVLAQREGEPPGSPSTSSVSTGLPTGTTSPGSATRMPTVPSTGATSRVLSSLACKSATVASASATLASASARSSAIGPALAAACWARLRSRSASRLGERGVALVELLAAGEVLGRQRNGTRVLLLGQHAGWPRPSRTLSAEDGDLLGADAGIDPVPLGPGAGRCRLGLAERGGQLGIVEHGQQVALARPAGRREPRSTQGAL